MIAAWMLYSILLTVFLAGAALLLERAAHLLGRPTRRIWAFALLGAALVPQVVWLSRISGEVEASLRAGAPLFLEPMAGWVAEAGPVLFQLEQPLLVAWGVVSMLLLGIVAAAIFGVHVSRRGWDRATLDGVDVRISEDVGPAVVGFMRSEIVLPRWVLSSDGHRQRLLLDHEREHVKEGDQRLTALALLVPILVPWNPMAWWIARRLRMAVEVDCDARVLRRSDCDVRTYGTLLLEMGRRRCSSSLPMAAFSRPRSQLEHRIERMTRPMDGARGRKAASLALVAGLLLASAGFVPTPPAESQFYVDVPWMWCDVAPDHRSAEATAVPEGPVVLDARPQTEAGAL